MSPTSPPNSTQSVSHSGSAPRPTSGPTASSPAAPVKVRWHWASALAGFLLAAILFGALSLWWRRPIPAPITIVAPPPLVTAIPAPSPTPASSPTPAPLVVFVSGAVMAPGVYQLPADARVVDALARAGGFIPEADVNAINQATSLRDGDQIHVPTLAVEGAPPPTDSTSADNTPAGITNENISQDRSLTVPVDGADAAPVGPINVNSASQAELETLPGIGEKRAQDIIANRPYVSVDDLERVPGIGPAILEDLRPLVVVE